LASSWGDLRRDRAYRTIDGLLDLTSPGNMAVFGAGFLNRNAHAKTWFAAFEGTTISGTTVLLRSNTVEGIYQYLWICR
jgi:hypothetical protein